MPNPSDSSEPVLGEKRRRRRANSAPIKTFAELYSETGERLGEGAFGYVSTYKHNESGKEYAVKVVNKEGRNTRQKVLKEIEIFHHCQGHDNILQLIEYFEESTRFYIVFEKMSGGSLLETIENRGHLTEYEASMVIRDIAKALSHLHGKGIAHRDLKPENILCVNAGQLTPVKLCDFDLGSGIPITSRPTSPIRTPELKSPVGSAEFMAPEVLDVWHDQAWSYDKRCDLWSLGIILYILLCGYPPFCGNCGQDCGWERGQACHICQEQLFKSIQCGRFGYPDKEWNTISASAKDLIEHLLVRDPHLRYSAMEVLQHPWITLASPQSQLATPRILLRNNSVRELGLFTETANAVNRLLLNHLSISEAFHPPAVYQVYHRSADLATGITDVIFQLDLSSDESLGDGATDTCQDFRQLHCRLAGEMQDVVANATIDGDAVDDTCALESGDEGVGETPRDMNAKAGGRDRFDYDHSKPFTFGKTACQLAGRRRQRETQLSGDSGFASGDTLSPSASQLGQTPPKGTSAMF